MNGILHTPMAAVSNCHVVGGPQGRPEKSAVYVALRPSAQGDVIHIVKSIVFSWKTPGRRLEDVDTSRKIPWKTRIWKNNINYYLYSYSDPCLPGHFARGVHVFQASSRRLPGKHNGFDNVCIVVLGKAWKTFGRRGRLSQNPLEDTDLEKDYK